MILNYPALLTASGITIASLAIAYLMNPKDGLGLHCDSVFGDEEIKIKIANPGRTVLNYIEPPAPNALIKLMTNNFQKREYGEGTVFYSWIDEQLSKGVKVRIVGGPQIEAKESIDNLLKKYGGLEIKLIEELPTQHYFTISSPMQLWGEQEHIGRKVKGCFYTRKPYLKVWEEVNSYLDGLFYGQAKNYDRIS